MIAIESPLLDELLYEVKIQAIQDAILYVLEGRFGAVTDELAKTVREIPDEARLQQVIHWMVQSTDLATFQARLTSGV